MRRNNRKGFTIVELVIVIAVIAILAGVLIPTFAGVTKNAKESKALQEVKAAYTVYMAEQLSAKADPAEKLYVDCDGIFVTVENGVASVVKTAPAGVDEYKLEKNSDGDISLVRVQAEETPNTPAEGGAEGQE